MSNNFKREANNQKRLRLHRILSVVICAFCLIYSLYAKDAENTVRLFFSLIPPLALIGFGDQIGSLTGIRFGGIGPIVNKSSPGSFICFFGWFFLCVMLLKMMV